MEYCVYADVSLSIVPTECSNKHCSAVKYVRLTYYML